MGDPFIDKERILYYGTDPFSVWKIFFHSVEKSRKSFPYCGKLNLHRPGDEGPSSGSDFQTLHDGGQNAVHLFQMLAEPFELLRPEGFIHEIGVLACVEPTSRLVLGVVPSQGEAESFFDGVFLGQQRREFLLGVGPVHIQFRADFGTFVSCLRVPHRYDGIQMHPRPADGVVRPMLRGWLLALHEAARIFHVGAETRPELELQLLVFRDAARRGRILYGARPIVGLADHIEFRGDGGIADLPQLDFEAEGVDFLVGVFVQPIQRGAVFIGESLGDPNDGDGIQPCGVGDQLSQVSVIGALQLVFDEHPCIVGGVLAKNIRAERADKLFLGSVSSHSVDFTALGAFVS